MGDGLEQHLARWLAAGVIDAAAAGRIRAFEVGEQGTRRGQWWVGLALAFGGVLIGAGILLFVAAHWDRLSPSERFTTVLGVLAALHAAALLAAGRFPALASTLHAVATVATGAGIFVSAQIFHLQTHWPNGVLLWAVAAWAGVLLVREWQQAALAAVITPAWIAGEWGLRAVGGARWNFAPLVVWHLGLAFAYLSARSATLDGPVRRALVWIGGLALLPAAVMVGIDVGPYGLGAVASFDWLVAFTLPIAVALALRGREAWPVALAIAWSTLLVVGPQFAGFRTYVWGLVGAIGLCAWGILDGRSERVNLGVAGFALTVVGFYFTTLFGRIGRAASLVALGVLFLAGGWALERVRRRLVARAGVTA